MGFAQGHRADRDRNSADLVADAVWSPVGSFAGDWPGPYGPVHRGSHKIGSVWSFKAQLGYRVGVLVIIAGAWGTAIGMIVANHVR
jgi:hypothetical protein